MTREEYDKIVAPVAPFEEIEKKPKKPKTIVEYLEEVWGHELSEWQKEYVTDAYEYYKASPNGMVIPCGRGSARTNFLAYLAVVFAAYEGKEIKPCHFITKEE